MADDVRMWLPLERKSGTQGTDEWVTDVPISLTNRFHVAVLLFSYRWQVMSECGYRKNKKNLHTRHSRVCHCCSFHILTFSVIHYCTDSQQHGIYLFYGSK